MDTQEEPSEYEAMSNGAANRAVVAGAIEAGGAGMTLDIGAGPAGIAIPLSQEWWKWPPKGTTHSSRGWQRHEI